MLSFGSAVGVSGCAPLDPAPGSTPSPPPSAPAGAAPVLPTNEEALAIVEELVPKFLAAEADLLQTGTTSALESLAVTAYVERVVQDYQDLQSRGLSVSGVPTLNSLEVQKVEAGERNVVISLYGCYDISTTQMLDGAGQDVLVQSAGGRSSVIVWVNDAEGDFKIQELEPWSGASFC